ncbi:MAG: ribosome recycling factor [Ignavibacteriales bacterium CG07_land_8_20_14_0_80_59_12]|nr:MAG: ribosome recycling factor [Ignavibacteriales bacterium CG07_land_8_20_14_0_80_59_12]
MASLTAVKDILKDADDRMHKAVEAVHHELIKIRTGKATTALLDAVKVDYYGTMMPLAQVASLSTPDIHLIAVTPWEKAMIPVIEKAILGANLGLNPSNDGTVVRVPIPPLSGERRRDLVKLVKKFGEEGKVAIRNIRRDANEHLKRAEKEEHLSEDERKKGETDVQKNTDRFIKDVDKILELKEKEIMEL